MLRRCRLRMVNILVRLCVFLISLTVLLFVTYNVIFCPMEIVKDPVPYDADKIVKKAPQKEKRKDNEPWSKVKVTPSVKPEKKLELISSFLSEVGLNVFIIEPDILQSFITNGSSSSSSSSSSVKCQHWCQSSDVITFGVSASNHPEEIQFTKFKDFTLYRQNLNSTSKFRNAISTNENAPSHLFLYNQPSGLLLHLVVFFERGDNFLWSDMVAFNNKPEWWLTHKLVYGETESAYPSFALEEKTMETIEVNLPSNIPEFLRHLKSSQFMECNRERADLFHRKFPTLSSEISVNISIAGKKMIKMLSHALNSINVPFRLSSGTLLGWYRECGFVSHTTDLDIEIHEKDYKNEIISTMLKHGFSFFKQFGKVHDHFEVAFLYEGINLDLFILYDMPDHSYVSVFNPWNGQKWRVVLPKSDDCSGELGGERVLVPCDVESYLMTNYGGNWFTPTNYWHLEHNQTNMVRSGYWDKKDFDFVVFAYDPLQTYFYAAYFVAYVFVCFVMYATN